MIDNFDVLYNYLDENLGPEEFYYLIVFRRYKDGDSLLESTVGTQKSDPVKAYYITSKDDLLKYKCEIVALCKVCNARAYLHPGKFSLRRLARHLLIGASICLDRNDFKDFRNNLLGSILESSIEVRYILDVDEGDMKSEVQIREMLEGVGCNELELPTKHGMHFIVNKDFCKVKKEFEKTYPGVSIHHNTPTVLYIPDYVQVDN